MKSKRSKACDISRAVKEAVWERDLHKCVLCGNPNAMPNAHIVPRSKGGMGVEPNIVTLCLDCHRRLDQTIERPNLLIALEHYIDIKYPEYDKSQRYYNKWRN